MTHHGKLSFSIVFNSFIALAIARLSLAQNSQQDYLSAHNAARATLSIPPLTWNNTVAAYALDYANQRSADCVLQHSDGPYGENLAQGYSTNGDFTGVDAVNLWVAEKPHYDYTSNSCVGGECLHYTQVVWKNTSQIGCARVQCLNGQGWFVICSYYPPGNYIGQRPY